MQIRNIKLTQPKPDADLVVVHQSKGGAVQIIIPAMQLHRWLLRAIRQELFK